MTMLCIVFTLTFDSSPIKGEGTVVRMSYCGFWIKSAMTGLGIVGWISDLRYYEKAWSEMMNW